MLSLLRSALLALFAISTFAACVSTRPRGECRVRSLDELSQLARIADSAGTAVRQSVDTMALLPRRFLQGVSDRLATLNRCGAVRSADDLRDAASAALSLRTLGMATVQQAYVWARAAVMADSADRRSWRVMAQAWDELQVLQRKPQWWGSVVSCTSPVLGRCALAPMDTTRVSEALRIEFGLPTLRRQRAFVDSLNRVRGQP